MGDLVRDCLCNEVLGVVAQENRIQPNSIPTEHGPARCEAAKTPFNVWHVEDAPIKRLRQKVSFDYLVLNPADDVVGYFHRSRFTCVRRTLFVRKKDSILGAATGDFNV